MNTVSIDPSGSRLPNYSLFWYYIGMAAYDDIYSISTENHGIVTTRDACRLGVRTKDIARWVKMGRLIRVGYGVYRTSQYPSSEEDSYAIAVAECGPEAYLYGESVLGLHRLTTTSANFVSVAVPRRMRRSLPSSYIIVREKPGYVPANKDGIPCQRVADAIRACIGRMMPERLEQATNAAVAEGLITEDELKDIKRDMVYAG